MLFVIMFIVFMSIVLLLVIFMFWLVWEGMGGFELSYVWNFVYVFFIVVIVVVLLVILVVYVVIVGKVGCLMEWIIYFGFGVSGIVMGIVLVYVGL